MRKQEIHTKFWFGNLMARELLGDQDLDGLMVLILFQNNRV